MQRVTITIDDDLLTAIDALCESRGYGSRSEAVRDIVRNALAPARAAGAGSAAFCGALSYVYSHGTRDLARRLTDEGLNVTLAVSLHAPDDELRDSLVPINTRWKAGEVVDAADAYARRTGRRYSV